MRVARAADLGPGDIAADRDRNQRNGKFVWSAHGNPGKSQSGWSAGTRFAFNRACGAPRVTRITLREGMRGYSGGPKEGSPP